MDPEPRFAWNGDSTVGYEVLGDGPFAGRGEHELKGAPDRRHLYRVVQ